VAAKDRLAAALVAAMLAAVAQSTPQSRNEAIAADAPASLRSAAAMGGSTDNGLDENVALVLASRGLIIPVVGVSRTSLRDTFNELRGANRHEAIDIAAPRRTPVVAVGDGTIVKLFRSIPGGITIYQFDPDRVFAYYYAHLDDYADGLKEGMRVKRGEVLGYVGTSGNAAPDAPHLHFAIFRLGPEKQWWKGIPIDPYAFLNDAEP